MRQQGFNLRVLMSVALLFPLFLVAAVNGMDQQDRGSQGHNSNWSGTKGTKSTEKTTNFKKKPDKLVHTAKMIAALKSKSDSYLQSEKLLLENLDDGGGYHFALSMGNWPDYIVLDSTQGYFDSTQGYLDP